MKRIFLSAALLVSLAGTAALAQNTTPAPQDQPQQFHHRQHSPEREAAHLAKVLNLTPDQSSKLEPILANRDQQMKSLFQNQQLAPQDRHAQMKTIHDNTEQQLATVLSPEQLQQMKEMRHHRGHGQWGQGQRPSGAPAA